MKIKYALPLLIIFMAAACLPQPASKSNSSKGGTPVDADGSGDGSGGGSNCGSDCTANEDEGVGPGTPIFQYNLLISGQKSWLPNNYSDSFAYESNIDLREGSMFFKTDNRLRVRFKVLPQPSPPTGDKYCYDRVVGSTSDTFKYTKLKFNLYLRDIICHEVNSEDSSKCERFGLGSRYKMQTVGPINVNDYSPIISLGSSRNHTQWGTVVEIAYVKSDSTCQANGTHCPAEDDVRKSSCWNMTMQVSTDYTQNFK